jgi:septal ring factor EnvC (AmiA/AmiB activator)
MEAEIAPAADAAAAAEASDAETEVAALPDASGPLSLGDSDRIRPAIAFASARGRLRRPVNGTEIHSFGSTDAFGGTAQGASIATRPGARIATPADGWVVYAGPFRSYGNLLIINAGGGYHILLAGMERIDVELGQFVLAGEPVAAMGARGLASAGATEVGASQPVLYVEFRKDGTAVDPGPWWAQPNDEKVGG